MELYLQLICVAGHTSTTKGQALRGKTQRIFFVRPWTPVQFPPDTRPPPPAAFRIQKLKPLEISSKFWVYLFLRLFL